MFILYYSYYNNNGLQPVQPNFGSILVLRILFCDIILMKK